ncbi:MAG TPA: hypothetical protein VKS79_03010 [Gemmataceae bacterium]|nr:hypothetical protein [Gemmataceae bacterium]
MTKKEREREYVKRWEQLGQMLERIRVQALRSPDYGKDWRLLDGLMATTAYHYRSRKTSGLVEQQRIFAKARR